MNPELDETQKLMQETVQAYLEKEVPLDRVRNLESQGEMDRGLWSDVCKQGWLALPFDEGLGGGGGSLVDAGLLVEAFARRAALVPLLETLVAGLALQRSAPWVMAASVLDDVFGGRCIPVPAVCEPHRRFDETHLEASDGRLTGTKAFVDYGALATHHLVSARDAEGPALYWVEAETSSVQTEPLQSIGRSPLVRVHYDGARGERVADESGVQALVLTGQALCAVQCVGSMQESLDQTVAYAQVREQFGKPIGSFQAVRHHAANMAMRVASARWLAYEALSALSAGRADAATIALAKASASRAAPEVTLMAHQIFGGNGVIEENDLYFFTLRGKESSLAWGSAEECLAAAAASVDQPIEWL